MKKIIIILSVLLFSISSFGQGVVSGHVYEQDGIVPIEGATVAFSGYSLEGDTLLVEFLSDTLGYYEATMEAGSYAVWAFAEGYQPVLLSDSLFVEEGQNLDSIDFLLHEIYVPVRYVAARHFGNDFVRLLWSMSEPLLYEDFESGDFSRFSWDNTLSDYPWVVTTHAYEGAFCMKSTCEGEADGRSEIEVSVYVPWSGEMRFQSKISSETNWDRGYFYIDNEKLLECSGESDWEEHCFAITEGEHLFRWAYVKDAINDDGDDCFYVDDIHFFVEEGLKGEKSFQYFDLFRRRLNEEPTLLASHLTDTLFMEMGWNSLPWGKYQWGVSSYYEGNRAMSDTVWSAYLDKDMTTAFEVSVSTNVGLSAGGAEVVLYSDNHDYQGVVNSDGHLVLPNVYRDSYLVSVYLDGFVDYVSDTLVSVMEPTQYAVELREAVKGVDSLYVSSTGWAIWQLSDTLYRNLQYFEIQLNGELVGTTDRLFFQLDVSQLNPGDSCLAQVRPVYLSEICGWRDCSWVYRSCADFQPTANGLTGVIRENGVLLSWDYPENDSVMGAVLFRDGELLDFVETDHYLDETVEMQGVTEYGLRIIYDGEANGNYYAMACEEYVSIIFPAFCDPPTKLYAENYLDDNDEYGALVSWGDRPEPVEAWLHYDNGQYKNAVGGGNEPVIFWSIRFDAEDLVDYQGTTIRKVALFDVGAGSYQLWIYKGGDNAPRTLIHSQNMTLSGSNAWHEENIVPQIDVPENEPVWVVIGQQGLSRPAAVCEDMDDADGRWVSLNGVDWTDLHTYNMHYTWMLRTFVSDRFGKVSPLGSDSYSLQHYNLYRSYNNFDYQRIAEIPSIEGQQYYHYRDVLVGETHDHFYYKLTAVYLSDENEECESDFAASLAHPDRDYVMVDDAWEVYENQAENIDVYPNPTNGQITIALESMQKVVVYNTLGQTLLNKEANGDVLQLDLSGFENGLYWIKVMAQNGTAVRSFVISR